MDSQLENELYCIKHCWGVYKQKSTVNSVRIDDWTTEWAIIANNELSAGESVEIGKMQSSVVALR